METLFLILLVVLMIGALSSGFPVAFALPGAAIISIGSAALVGYVLAGDPSAYFISGGPVQWLSAGVTNFRGVYWEVERDTLIAIPLFIFMGIMLQRSKIAEDLLVAMGRLFGPIPGGLGVSVVLVGGLLAATTGIVGATVVAMGLISLPAMLRNGYSKPLATGTICASGTLGQIIPPSIVLIILADQLASAADQAGNLRTASYKAATGEFSMPGEFAVTSASAGDMFLGAFLPGMVLVGLYIAYVLGRALLKPESAPPVSYDGAYDRRFWVELILALAPPMALILSVLGSIILGVATVNQAGALGATGAILMASYRLVETPKRRYWPVILAAISLLVIAWARSDGPINVRSLNGGGDLLRVGVAAIGSIGLLSSVAWGIWRTATINNILTEVGIETVKTSSMVFIILIGAAMLTAAFRGFGGEDLVRELLYGLPGGFWGQFVVVMLVIFILGFFLDFIEIAVVVVPIVAPILLANPEANITAVWLGVMVGLNMQTSFLTPPFGFALFYLRGIAPPEVKTVDIYKGASVFIGLQLLGLLIVGIYPSLVNYLPTRTQLTAETAPPPINPRLQQCLEMHVFEQIETDRQPIKTAVQRALALDTHTLPAPEQKTWRKSLEAIGQTYAKIEAIQVAEQAAAEYQKGYADYHREIRAIEQQIAKHKVDLKKLKAVERSGFYEEATKAEARAQSAILESEVKTLTANIPADWKQRNAEHRKLTMAEKRARTAYRRHVDDAYLALVDMQAKLNSVATLGGLRQAIAQITIDPNNSSANQVASAAIKDIDIRLAKVPGMNKVRSALSKVSRALKKENSEAARAALTQAQTLVSAAWQWRTATKPALETELNKLEQQLRPSIGLRQQARLTDEQADIIASCLAVHRDISLAF